ncbi:MAG: extracellular solute-binding protein [Eggerthellaceae bacterium]|nr:extracellular solute-binding protein [Eggerthellaceae bacterium]
MKKNTKWLITLLACLGLVSIFALAACSGGATNATSASASADAEASASTEAEASASAEEEATSEAAEESSAAAEPASDVQLQVFAANSLSKAMDEAQALYTEQAGVTFADTQYLSSGDLNAELEGGAYADLEITASKKTMDTAEEKGFVDPNTRTTMFVNDLVMVTSESNSEITEVTLEDIASGKYKICVGDDSVPAGNYANQSLSTVGCFTDPEGKTGSESAGKAEGTDAYVGTPIEGKVVTDTSVGNVCKHAESGDVDIAFVYSSDVYRFGGVKIVGTVPGDTHKNIQYPGAVCAQSNYPEEAAAFLDWCMTDTGAQEIWQKWGFELA